MNGKKCLMAIWYFMELFLVAPLFLASLLSRFIPKPINVGLGPEPLINNIYYKAALMRYGYTAETFVDKLYHITSEFDHIFFRRNLIILALFRLFLLVFYLFRYKCLYLYFTGGVLGRNWLLWRLEAPLLKLAGIKIVVMPYGSDVQDMTRSPNLNFKHVYSQQYKTTLLRRKLVSAKVDYWSRNANHIISSSENVRYMHVWDTLMPSHLPINTEKWRADHPPQTTGPFVVLHAPNHRHIKGTRHFMDAVEELRAHGLDIHLVLLEGVNNDEIRAKMEEVHVVADQLIIGWYGMFAVEGMAMSKPVLCYLRDDLKDLYITAGLLEPDEIPIVECCPDSVKDTIARLYRQRNNLSEVGRRSREFVERHHSLCAVGAVLDRINQDIGVLPSTRAMDSAETTAQAGGDHA